LDQKFPLLRLYIDINIVEICCQQSFSFRLPSDILRKRFDKFLDGITRENEVSYRYIVNLVKFFINVYFSSASVVVPTITW